jgi:uncharacterized protein
MALELLMMLPALLLLVLANYTEKRKEYRILTQVFLMMLIVLAILRGAMSAFIDVPTGEASINIGTYGYGIMISGIFALFILLKPVRKAISQLIPIEPDNWLHATAIVFAILAVGMSLSTALSVDVVEFSRSSGYGGSTIILQNAIFAISSFLGIGWLSRRNLKESLKRLGIGGLGPKEIALTFAFTAMLFLVVIIIGLITLIAGGHAAVEPIEDVEDPTIQILGTITILGAIVFAISAGIGEEILFRGALQPRFGIVLTSLVFTAMHIQYFDLVSMSTLFIISVVLGYERKMINTTAAIVSHASYNMVLLLMVALA